MDRAQPIGEQLRDWRQLRRISQMDLALDAGISTRHLSFVETGRSKASRQVLAILAEQLQIPLRDRNLLFLAAGYAPIYTERPLDHPEMASARNALDLVLKGHEPFPAMAIDRHWNLMAANAVVGMLISGADPELLKPPVNVLRLSLHPKGLASSIRNLGEWKAHLLERLKRQIAASGDTELVALLRELSGYPASSEPTGTEDFAGLYVPMLLSTPDGDLNFFSTTTVFGTPLDITLSELAVEAFFPADAETAERLRKLAAATAVA